MCMRCGGTGRIKVKVGYHYRNNQDPIFAIKVDYEQRDCPVCANAKEDAGIKLVSMSESIDTTTPMGKMFLTICAAFAQMERDLISERTKAGIAAHRARGGTMGKKHFVKDHPARLARAREIADLVLSGGITGVEFVAEMHKVQPEPRIKSVQSFYNWRSTNKGKRPPFEGLIADTPLDDVEIDDG